MKDYYYILGFKSNASYDDIKKAYRKLSLKFHPDKNDGDDFFTEHFKELQEAYEILSNEKKRKIYHTERGFTQPFEDQNENQSFPPEIEFFNSSKDTFESDEQITFSWKTNYADKVVFKPFGVVGASGKKTYKIKDLKNPFLNFELIAENSFQEKRVTANLILHNLTYQNLYKHFKTKINSENEETAESREEIKEDIAPKTKPKNTSNTLKKLVEEFESKSFLLFLLFLAFAIYALYSLITGE